MRKLRKCSTSNLSSGTPKCLPDMNKVKGAIVCKKGTRLPANLTAEELERLAHAGLEERIYGIFTFVEYAKEGGDVQTSTTGYGPEEVTGIAARKDTFTLKKFNPVLNASIIKCHNQPYDVYYIDEDKKLFGIDDGDDMLAGIPMSGIYSNATEYNTSSAKPEMTVTFCYEDAKEAAIGFDFVKLDFNPERLTLGLVPVKFEKADSGYKIYEAKGAYDLTPIYGPLIAREGQKILDGASSAVTYEEATETLTIAGSGNISLKAPSVLFENNIKGIEQV